MIWEKWYGIPSVNVYICIYQILILSFGNYEEYL